MTRTIVLARGSHPAPAGGAPAGRCLFEWYNWLTRGEHTDSRPAGVSAVLHAFGRRLNDILPDGPRQHLTRFLPDGREIARAAAAEAPPAPAEAPVPGGARKAPAPPPGTPSRKPPRIPVLQGGEEVNVSSLPVPGPDTPETRPLGNRPVEEARHHDRD